MTSSRRGFFVLLVALSCWSLAWTQDVGPGRIDGRVVKDGNGVSAVVVILNELKLTEVTDDDGNFVFENLAPGGYTLIFSLGDNTATRLVIVEPAKTADVLLEVSWEIGLVEDVEVTAVQRAQKIVDAPAAVTSIPAEEIEVQVAHGQVPKILEFTPGAEVTQSGLYDFNFNTRGFNSSLNRRVSTYIDGRDVGVVLLGAQEWAAIAGGLDDVARLDFIRGPSAALYGANASSGVLNITTKAPIDSQGVLLRMTAGQLETRSVDLRWAQKIGNGWYSKLIGGFKNSGDFTVSRNPGVVSQPEYSEFCELVGETDCLPEEKSLFITQDDQIRYGGLRFDKYVKNDAFFTIEAGYSSISGPVFQTGIGRVQNLDSERPFYRISYATPRWNVLAHYSNRKGNQANLTRALVADFELITDTERYGVEAQGNFSFAQDRLRLVIGGAHTEENVDTENPETGEQTVVYEPIEADRQALFSQLDWTINRKLSMVFAGRVDASTLHETQFSPKVALVYSINGTNSLRFTYNQAFQVANYSEFFLHTRIASFPIGGFVRTICGAPVLPEPVDCGIDEEFLPILAVGNNDLALEQTNAWEVGYTGLWGKKVFMTLDYYNAVNENFITDLVPQVGTILGNLDGCLDVNGNQETDPRQCPINSAYLPWVSTPEAETTFLIPPPIGLTVAQALRNAVDNSVGGNTLGFELAQDLDGSTVVVGRTYANIGQVDTQGVDLGIQAFVTRSLAIQASYSWFDYDIVDADALCESQMLTPIELRECKADLDAILLPNTPENKGSLGLTYVKRRWSAGIAGRYVEGFRWSAGVFQGDVPDYTTMDLFGTYSFNDLVTLGVNVANFRDNVHRQTFGGDLLSRRALLNLTLTW